MVNKRGFTLIEVLVAVFVIVIGVVGVFSLVQQVEAISGLYSSKLVAAYLAQEGVEIVRNIRDSNILEIYGGESTLWDDGLNSDLPQQADYRSLALTLYTGDYLGINGDGFYGYSGDLTRFKREININKPGECSLEVTVKVSWRERVRDYSITVREDLFNWYNCEL